MRIRSSGYAWLPKPVDLDKFRVGIDRLVAQAIDNQHLSETIVENCEFFCFHHGLDPRCAHPGCGRSQRREP